MLPSRRHDGELLTLLVFKLFCSRSQRFKEQLVQFLKKLQINSLAEERGRKDNV